MTAICNIWHDPGGISKRDTLNIEHSDFREFLISYFGPDGFDTPTAVYKNNVRLDLSEYKDKPIHVGDNDLFLVISSPLGVEIAVIGFFAFIGGLILANLLIKKPEIPEIEKFNEGPNNSLIGQQNVTRPLQRIPDLFGKNRVYPDLIQVAYFEYIGHRKVWTEYFCIGRGEFLIEDIKNSETLISEIDESTATVYGPDTAPATLLDVVETKAANGQDINPIFTVSKDLTFTYANNYTEFTATDLSEFSGMVNGENFLINFAPVPRVTTDGLATDIEGGFEPFTGNKVTKLTGNFLSFSVGDIVLFSGSAIPINNGYYRIRSITDNTEMFIESPFQFLPKIPVTETGAFITITNPVVEPEEYNGIERGLLTFDQYIPGVPDTVRCLESLAPSDPTVVVGASITGFENTVGPYQLVENSDEVWIDVVFDVGNDIAVEFEVSLQSFGGSSITNFTIDARPNQPGFYTKKFPLNPANSYTIEVYRITEESDTNVAKIGRIASVRTYSGIDFGDVTTMQVVTTSGGTGTGTTREINAIATRKLRTYDLDTQTIIETLAPTEKFADAIFHVLTDPISGNKDPSQIDLDQLYTIQDSLDGDPIYGDSLGKFSYSFADSSVKLSSEISTIMNAVRGFAYREGDIYRFVRDEQKPRSALFNTRNKKPDSESKTINLQRFDDNDGIELSWQSSETAQGFTIVFPEGSTPSNPRRITAAGIKNYDQAWNRAKYEYLRLIYQRTSVQTQVTQDGILVSLNDRVANVDGTNLRAQTGEIIGFVGLEVETSEIIDFESNPTATAILSNDDGTVQDVVTVTPRTDGVNGFILSESRSIVLRGQNEYQVGTRYTFSAVSNHDSEDYLIQDVSPGDDGYVTVKMINYDERIYAPDSEVPTPQS